MKVKMNFSIAGPSLVASPGDVVDVTAKEAKALVAKGLVVKVTGTDKKDAKDD